MTEGRFAEACPKFAESQRIEPGTGTLLNLAACNEQLGKTATAWSQFSEAYQLLLKQNDAARAEYAQEHRDGLARRLSKITLRVADASPNLTVKLDDVPVGKAAWGVGIAIDPGTHQILAEAPGRKPWSRTVEIGMSVETPVVDVPTLAVMPGASEPEGALAASARPDEAAEDRGRPLTAPVVIAGVATLALAAGAGVTGALYVSKKNSYDDINGQPGASRQAIEDRKDAVTTMGVVNLALIGAATAGAITTIVLYFNTPTTQGDVALVPWVTQGAAGTTLRGSF